MEQEHSIPLDSGMGDLEGTMNLTLRLYTTPMLVGLLAIGNQVPLSGLRGSLHGLPIERKCVLRLCFLSALES